MLALRIALRYLFAKKSHRAVNVIAVISMAGVAVATMAIIVVLSVFNGFTDLAQSHLAAIDPEVRIAPLSGKVIESADSLARALESRDDVASAAVVLQERALFVSGDRQTPVIFKGLDPAKARRIADIDAVIIDGVFAPDNGMPDSLAGMQASVGVAINMGLHPSPYSAGRIYVPRRLGRINPANPAAAYRALDVAVTGVVQVDQPEYDADFVFIPLEAARRMLDYDAGEGSAVELKAAQGVRPDELVRRLAKDLPQYEGIVLLRDAQPLNQQLRPPVDKHIAHVKYNIADHVLASLGFFPKLFHFSSRFRRRSLISSRSPRSRAPTP